MQLRRPVPSGTDTCFPLRCHLARHAVSGIGNRFKPLRIYISPARVADTVGPGVKPRLNLPNLDKSTFNSRPQDVVALEPHR